MGHQVDGAGAVGVALVQQLGLHEVKPEGGKEGDTETGDGDRDSETSCSEIVGGGLLGDEVGEIEVGKCFVSQYVFHNTSQKLA